MCTIQSRTRLFECFRIARWILLLAVSNIAAQDISTNRIVLDAIIRGKSQYTGRIVLTKPATNTNAFALHAWPDDVLGLDTNVVVVSKDERSQAFLVASKALRYREVTVVAQSETDRLQASITVIPSRLSKTTLVVVGGSCVLLLLFVLPFFAGGRGLRFLFVGEDGLPSTSKCQATLWTIAVFFAYPTIALAKWLETGAYAMPIPGGLAVAMGVSLATAAGAKAITQNQIESGIVKKVPVARGTAKRFGLGFLFMTDAEKLDLGKVQLMGWTFIGLAIFVGEWIRTITLPDAKTMTLPDLDGALWVLMGLANGAYLGGKLVRTGGFEGFEILFGDPPTVVATSPKDVTLVGNFKLSASAKINVIVDGKPDATWLGTRKDDHVVTIKLPSGLKPGVVVLGLEIDGVNSANKIKLQITQSASSN